MSYITNRDYFHEVSANRVAGANERILNASTLTLIGAGVTTFIGTAISEGFPTSAETLDVVSDDAADTAAGTGARTIVISGLDATFAAITETVIMDGVTPATTIQSFLRVNDIVVLTAGTSQWNEGTILITGNSTADIYSALAPTVSISRTGRYTVPLGKKSRVILISTNASKATQGAAAIIDVFGYIRPSTTDAAWQRRFETRLDTNASFDIILPAQASQFLPEKTDVMFTYAANNANCRLNVRTIIVEELN